MTDNFKEQLLYDESYNIFKDFYRLDMQTRINYCDKLTPFVTRCDQYIAEFLHQEKPELVTLYRKLIEFYFAKPFVSVSTELSHDDIGKIASSATMNLAETGTLDENLDITKALIS